VKDSNLAPRGNFAHPFEEGFLTNVSYKRIKGKEVGEKV
jgi:hypothetical protein